MCRHRCRFRGYHHLSGGDEGPPPSAIQQAKGEIPIEVITQEAEAEDGDWAGQEPQIDESQIAAQYDCEILVIGCGTGGMFAVASAAEEGANVIGIDRFPTGVGIRDDLGALNSRYQQAWGTKIDKFDYITMATQYAAGHISQDLVRLFCEESGKVIDWYGDRLAERGVELWHESGDSDDQARYHHFPTGHSPAGPAATTETATCWTATRCSMTTPSSWALSSTTTPR